MILYYLFYVYLQSMLHWWVYSIYSISVDLFDCYFSPSFSPCYYVTLKMIYKTSNLSNNAFFKHFVLENNLIFNIIRLTILASENLELIQKNLHLKGNSFHQLLIPTKRYLSKKFSPYCSQDPYGHHHFLEKCWHQQFFRAVFVNFHVWENFPQERKFNWVDLYVNNKGLTEKMIIPRFDSKEIVKQTDRVGF